MGNLCSIFHSRFKNLIKVIPSARKAQLMDYILLGWQTSTYKLKGSNQKWFMKPYAEIAEDTAIPKSTLERYIKEFTDAGFIERKQALYCRTKEDGQFVVKKGAYINVTEKLLTLIKPSDKTPPKPVENTHNNNNESDKDSHSETVIKEPDRADDDINEVTDPTIMRGLYIRDLYPSFLINTISLKKLNHSVDNRTLNRLVNQFETIQKLFDEKIKEEIPDEVKKLVLGTFFNLTFKHKVFFSCPDQIAAEYLYALINVEFYLPNVTCFKFRNNILAKIMRENRWRTPKGFFNHFYLGQNFKDKQELRDERWQEEKNKEMTADYKFNKDYKDERLIAVEEKITEKAELIEVLTESIYEQSGEEMILIIREKIEIAKKEIESLWNQQSELEKELERANIFNDERLCA